MRKIITHHFDKSIRSLCERYSPEVIDWFCECLGSQLAQLQEAQQENGMQRPKQKRKRTHEEKLVQQLESHEHVLNWAKQYALSIDQIRAELDEKNDRIEIMYAFYLTLFAFTFQLVASSEFRIKKQIKIVALSEFLASIWNFKRNFSSSSELYLTKRCKTLQNVITQNQRQTAFGFS